MSDEKVGRVIRELEQELLVDDPEFVRRIEAAPRKEAICFVAVMLLLTVGAVLLTLGVATTAPVPWSLGLIALVGAVLVDDHHKRAMR